MPTSLRSYAKINLGLLIGPPALRSDGFHELRTIYQTIALYDTVSVKLTKGQTGVEIKCKDPRVPQDETNTCWRVAERMPSKTSMGRPPGFAAVFNMSGGTALTNTALATRPCGWPCLAT